MTKDFTPITVAYGDGIGPEIMDATLRILKEAGARITIESIEVGKRAYEQGHTSGIPSRAWESIKRNKILLKAPITTPQGGGYKSLNVTLRKTLGLYSNVRPCISYPPFVRTIGPKFDLVVVRENEEDLYSGMEYRQTDDVFQGLKIITRPATERIVRYAFEYAVANKRKKVTCFVKDNIMKLCDGAFAKIFTEIAKEYPQIESNKMIIDIASAKLAVKPQDFDVIVTLNLYGDIVSDIAAEVSGSVGLAGSANIGSEYAMFEAIHGSAPDIADKGIANPSGLLNGACMMLVHIGQPDVAEVIQNAWRRTIEEGIHTADIYVEGNSTRKVSTTEFADAVIANIAKDAKPETLDAVHYSRSKPISAKPLEHKEEKVELVGSDIYIYWNDKSCDPNKLAAIINSVEDENLELQNILNRGLTVWPGEVSSTYLSNCWRLRYFFRSKVKNPEGKHVANLAEKLHGIGLDFSQIINLYNYDGVPGFTVGQGE